MPSLSFEPRNSTIKFAFKTPSTAKLIVHPHLLNFLGCVGHFVIVTLIDDNSLNVNVRLFSVKMSESRVAELTIIRKSKILEPSFGIERRIISVHGVKVPMS